MAFLNHKKAKSISQWFSNFLGVHPHLNQMYRDIFLYCVTEVMQKKKIIKNTLETQIFVKCYTINYGSQSIAVNNFRFLLYSKPSRSNNGKTLPSKSHVLEHKFVQLKKKKSRPGF